MEQELKVIENGQYKNLILKPSKKQREQGVEGLKPGNYIFVEKTFPEGLEIPSKQFTKPDGSPQLSYACKALYKGEEVSFFLKEQEHEAYKVLGGEGDKLKITADLRETKKGTYYVTFKFDLVTDSE